ncbi:MAG: transglycosylase SLT domain-containing protein, partial [Aridibacter sp.]
TGNYQSVVNRNSVLKEYALWHLSQIMRATGNLLMERLYLQELSLFADKSLLRIAVNKRFARSYFESRNYSEAIKLIGGQRSELSSQADKTKSIVEDIKEEIPLFDKNLTREDLVLLGEAYLLNKQTEHARGIFNKLVNNPPNKDQPDDFALAGAKGLDLLEVGEENFGKTAPNLSDEEHFKRAEIYQFNRNFLLARTHYEAIVTNYPMSKKVPISLFQIGRGYGQERNYDKAANYFERLQAEHPENDLAKSALYQAADAYANLNKLKEAVSRYQKYIYENPDADNLERAYLNIIDAYRDAGESTTALHWTAKTRETFKDEPGEAAALFSQVRIHLSQQDWQNALRDLDGLSSMKDLGGIKIAGGTNEAEVKFLRGFVLEKLGRFYEAIDAYLSIEDGLKSYYGWRANERLRDLSKNENTAKFIEQNFRRYSSKSEETLTNENAEQIKESAQKAFRLTENDEAKTKLLARIQRAYSLLDVYKKIPNGKLLEFGRKKPLQVANKNLEATHKNIADEFLFLGLYDEATPELETSLREDLAKNTNSQKNFSEDTAYTLAVFYKRGEMANRAVSYAEPRWKKIPNDYQIELIPREFLELLYPKPYQASLNKYGKAEQVDPLFMLSIMRQESRFNADIKSAAAARGLMQFISDTSNKMANEMNIENFHQDDLYNPPTAIRFGSHYISNIFREFPNQPPAVAASYNGGEDRMLRWFKRANSLNPDRYVPEIVFTQTKDYVYKVMANYRIYQMLYEKN